MLALAPAALLAESEEGCVAARLPHTQGGTASCLVGARGSDTCALGACHVCRPFTCKLVSAAQLLVASCLLNEPLRKFLAVLVHLIHRSGLFCASECGSCSPAAVPVVRGGVAMQLASLQAVCQVPVSGGGGKLSLLSRDVPWVVGRLSGECEPGTDLPGDCYL